MDQSPGSNHGAQHWRGCGFLQLRPASAPPKGLTDWLVVALRAAIADGRLGVGAQLPATRVLADDLRVSRGVVVEAYRRLADEGLVSARTGVGTVVTPLGPPPRRPAPSTNERWSAAGPLAPPLPLPQPVAPVGWAERAGR